MVHSPISHYQNHSVYANDYTINGNTVDVLKGMNIRKSFAGPKNLTNGLWDHNWNAKKIAIAPLILLGHQFVTRFDH